MPIAVTYNKDQQLAALRVLGDYVSVWLDSLGPLPTPLRRVWIAWLNEGKIPTMGEVRHAIFLSNKWREVYQSTEGWRLELKQYDENIKMGNPIGKAMCEGMREADKTVESEWKR